jgi:hypothetical protein
VLSDMAGPETFGSSINHITLGSFMYFLHGHSDYSNYFDGRSDYT